MTIEFKRTLVTPELAKKWLSRSVGNRAVQEDAIARFGRMMLDDQWEDAPGSPITFDADGKLANGHHRLSAVAAVGKSVWMYVVRGSPKEATRTYDMGRARSLADQINAFANEPAFHRIAQKVPWRSKSTAAMCGYLLQVISARKGPTCDEAVRLCKKYEKAMIVALDKFGKDQVTRNGCVLVAIVLALQWADEQDDAKHYARIIAFFEQVRTGEMLERGESAYALREYLLAVRSHIRTGAGRGVAAKMDSQWVILMKVLRATQAFIAGERLTKLQLVSNPANLIEFYVESRDALAKKLKLKLTSEEAP